MFAFCDLRTGKIRFAATKPHNAAVIAEHPNASILREAVRQSGAQEYLEAPEGDASSLSLGVPWFATAKSPDEQDERFWKFARKVREWLGDYPRLQ